jgi:hypothetical protein
MRNFPGRICALIWTRFRLPQLKGRKYEALDNISVVVFILTNWKNDGSRFDHYHRKPNDGPCNPQASCHGGQNDGESGRSFEIFVLHKSTTISSLHPSVPGQSIPTHDTITLELRPFSVNDVAAFATIKDYTTLFNLVKVIVQRAQCIFQG